jgi:hypothetical protein
MFLIPPQATNPDSTVAVEKPGPNSSANSNLSKNLKLSNLDTFCKDFN